ncbi:MAG: dihydroorotate dehydrogenase [Candidatus Omnitrophota bacterium]
MKTKISVNIGRLKLKNPVMVSSGTFGYGEEFSDFVELKKIGAIVSKTITLNPRKGNPPPRTCETPGGMLNSIGLENPGLNAFIGDKLSVLVKTGAPVIVSIASESGIAEFVKLAGCLDKLKEVAAIEVNISCPNVRSAKRMATSAKLISQDPKATYETIRAIRKVTGKTLIAKLSPNVTDISEIALASEAAGSDAVSLINTLTGMSIDVDTRKPKIACVTAGLSGPAIRPIAVRMVWEVYRAIKLPVIGMGGINDVNSALEFLIAGASAVSIGTANFINPGVAEEIISGLGRFMVKNKITDIKQLIGSVKLEK